LGEDLNEAQKQLFVSKVQCILKTYYNIMYYITFVCWLTISVYQSD
jgi:hypothetical protein